jgi:hypothetical protein
MQATTCFHDGVTYPVLQKTDFVFDDPVAFSPTNGVFNPDSDRGNTTLRCFLRGREFSSRRVFLGLDERDVLQAESLEALILLETAGQQASNAFVVIGKIACEFPICQVTGAFEVQVPD